MWPIRRYPQIITIGEAAFAKHGGKSILIARFTPAIRAIVPLVAGVVGMNPWRFYAVNIVSAFAWAPAHILPAVLAGASLALFGAVGGRLLVLVLVVLLLLWIAYLAIRYLLRRGLPWLAELLVRLWTWGRERDTWISREILSLVDPRQREAKALALLAALLGLGLWTFFGVLGDLRVSEPFSLADTAVFNFLQGLHTSWSDQVMVAIAELGDPPVAIAVAAVVALWLLARRAWHATLYWLGAVGATLVFVLVLDLLSGLQQPLGLAADAASGGVPGGHTAIDLVVYGFLTILVGRELGPRSRAVVVMAAAFLIGMIAFARLYLGAHWTSNVMAGVGFGLSWIAALGLAYVAHRPGQVGGRSLIAVVGVVFLAAAGFHVSAAYPRDIGRFVVVPKTTEMAVEVWWHDGWAELPARRIDLIGGLVEPLTLQWAGPLELLKQRLLARGWQEPPPWTLESALAWLRSGPDPATLPVLTRLHDGRPAELILVHPEPDRPHHRARLILRMWNTSLVVDSGATKDPVWVGAVIEQRLYRFAALLTLGVADRDLDAPRPVVVDSFVPGRLVFRPARQMPFGWNGWLVLSHDPGLELMPPDKRIEP